MASEQSQPSGIQPVPIMPSEASKFRVFMPSLETASISSELCNYLVNNLLFSLSLSAERAFSIGSQRERCASLQFTICLRYSLPTYWNDVVIDSATFKMHKASLRSVAVAVVFLRSNWRARASDDFDVVVPSKCCLFMLDYRWIVGSRQVITYNSKSFCEISIFLRNIVSLVTSQHNRYREVRRGWLILSRSRSAG